MLLTRSAPVEAVLGVRLSLRMASWDDEEGEDARETDEEAGKYGVDPLLAV